jgi:hypothetical protein
VTELPQIPIETKTQMPAGAARACVPRFVATRITTQAFFLSNLVFPQCFLGGCRWFQRLPMQARHGAGSSESSNSGTRAACSINEERSARRGVLFPSCALFRVPRNRFATQGTRPCTKRSTSHGSSLPASSVFIVPAKLRRCLVVAFIAVLPTLVLTFLALVGAVWIKQFF